MGKWNRHTEEGAVLFGRTRCDSTTWFLWIINAKTWIPSQHHKFLNICFLILPSVTEVGYTSEKAQLMKTGISFVLPSWLVLSFPLKWMNGHFKWGEQGSIQKSKSPRESWSMCRTQFPFFKPNFFIILIRTPLTYIVKFKWGRLKVSGSIKSTLENKWSH